MIILSLFLIALSISLIGWAIGRFFLSQHDKLTRRLLIITASLILSILTLEGAFVCQSGHFAFPATILTDIMQAFSLDADYEAVAYRSWNAFSWTWLETFLSYYSLFLYTLAPIVGGAVIYDVLAGVSPAIRLAFSKRKELYVFSELNERAMLLAESIAGHNKHNRGSAFVFTDAYINSENEDENELLLRAKAIGAICLQDDILNCSSFRASRKCHFFLMDFCSAKKDFDDAKNLATLHQFLNSLKLREPLWNIRKGCEVVVFSNDSETIESIRVIKKMFDNSVGVDRTDQNRMPCGTVTVNAIRDNALTAGILLRDKPLFQPLGVPHPGHVEPLRVVIFGNNSFSKELFKSVFWIGQLLDTQLCITVVYSPSGKDKSTHSEFEEYLNRLCPEIMESCMLNWKSECLRIWPQDERYASPYALLSFLEVDIETVDIRSFIDNESRTYLYSGDIFYRIADCDYFIVAEGDDSQNIELTNRLYNSLIYLQSRSNRTGRPKQNIATLIQNDDLSKILHTRFLDARNVQYSIHGIEPPDVYPFGSLKERYSYKQVFSPDEELARRGSGSSSRISEHGFADITTVRDDIYSSWSNVGRILHLPYKMYSAGCADNNYIENCLAFRRKLENDHTLFTRLTWLEHRRWNAFLRVQGFTKPFIPVNLLEKAFGSVMPTLLRTETNADTLEILKQLEISDSLLKANPSGHGVDMLRICGYKDVQAKLQPCLVESDPSRIQDPDHHDMLDLVTAARLYINLISSSTSSNWEKLKDKSRSDVKTYDMPWGDRLPLLDLDEVLSLYDRNEILKKGVTTIAKNSAGTDTWDLLFDSGNPLGKELASYYQKWEIKDDRS